MEKIKVLIADDHRLLREGLAHIIALQPDMQVVAEAGNGEEAVASFTAVKTPVPALALELGRDLGAVPTDRRGDDGRGGAAFRRPADRTRREAGAPSRLLHLLLFAASG